MLAIYRTLRRVPFFLDVSGSIESSLCICEGCIKRSESELILGDEEGDARAVSSTRVRIFHLLLCNRFFSRYLP